VPHLLQYVSNGDYYGSIKLNGKTICQSLETAVWTTARLKLADFLKGRLAGRSTATPPLFREAVELFKRELESEMQIKPQSKKHRLWCLAKLEKTWPGLWDLRIDEITREACREWSARVIKEIACHSQPVRTMSLWRNPVNRLVFWRCQFSKAHPSCTLLFFRWMNDCRRNERTCGERTLIMVRCLPDCATIG
jgi:hypothetical protein